MPDSPLSNIVAAQKQGKATGISSICSAHPYVIEAAFRRALNSNELVLIESTCNQVNQYGGYTGLTPPQFVAYVLEIAAKCHFPRNKFIIGGDHLGPNPWQNEAATQAMDKSRVLIQDYIRAGYQKIHLDASMKCADDDPHRPLDKRISAQRAAELAMVAENSFRQLDSHTTAPRYIIGTEVPIPGGAQEHEELMVITPPADVEETIEITKQAFFERGLETAWERVIAVVVQPGVEFGDANLFEYQSEQAQALSQFIRQHERLVYEAHSTDYQTASALKRMVEDHFAILKVGPALTFAFREAVFGLSLLEEEMFAAHKNIKLSQLRHALEEAMLKQPLYWQKYYPGSPQEQRLARKYSFSDRSRYYWPVAEVQTSLKRLIQNLQTQPLPYTLLSQYLPLQYQRIRNGIIANTPQAIMLDKIASVLSDYAFACGES